MQMAAGLLWFPCTAVPSLAGSWKFECCCVIADAAPFFVLAKRCSALASYKGRLAWC